jgi:hypothetical protein
MAASEAAGKEAEGEEAAGGKAEEEWGTSAFRAMSACPGGQDCHDIVKWRGAIRQRQLPGIRPRGPRLRGTGMPIKAHIVHTIS